MNLETAVKGMLEARAQLRSMKGITDPFFISEQMQRLAQYTGAVEESLAKLEEQYEFDEHMYFKQSIDEGKSVNQAELLAKQEVGKQKGELAKLKRYVNSSWQIIGVAQSRFNHLQKSTSGQI